MQTTEYGARMGFFYFDKNGRFDTVDIVQILEKCTIMETYACYSIYL